MKHYFKLFLALTYLFSTFSYGQVNYDDAINIQQMAKELYFIKALNIEVEKDLYENVTLKYDEKLDKIALERANSLLNDLENNNEIYRGANGAQIKNYGEKQLPAGLNISPVIKPLGTRIMKSNNAIITPTLGGISNIEYKGNAVLNANR